MMSGSIAAVAVGFAEYLSYFAPVLSTSNVLVSLDAPWGVWSVSAGQLVAAASIGVLGAVNYVGVRTGNMVNVVLTAAKVAGLLAIPIMVLIAGTAEPAFTPVVPPDVARPLASFGIAMIAVLSAPVPGVGYPLVPAIFVLGSAAFVLNTLLERPAESVAGLGLVALGIPVYWYKKR